MYYSLFDLYNAPTEKLNRKSYFMVKVWLQLFDPRSTKKKLMVII